MRSLFFTVLSIYMLAASPAGAQDAQDKVPLTVTRAELQIIGQGLMELPYKTAAGPLATLQQQLNAHDTAVVEAAKAKAAEAAKPKDPDKVPETPAAPPAK